MEFQDQLRALIAKHEGLRLLAYRDTVGKITVGYGRNLTDKGISRDEAMMMLDNDIGGAEAQCSEKIQFFASLVPARQAVLIDMCFNMGINGLLGFTKTLAAIEAGDYGLAATLMLASKWALQVGSRAVELAAMMRTGEFQ